MNFKQKIIAKKLDEELKIKNGVIKVDEVSCDGCNACVEACPTSAISIITLSDDQIKKLPFKGRLKVKVKGADKAIIDQEQCITCGICMKHCHEFAIHKTAV